MVERKKPPTTSFRKYHSPKVQASVEASNCTLVAGAC